MKIITDAHCHKLLTKSSEVDQLCLPLKKQLGVTYFNYVKLSNNQRTLLTNRAKYISDFYQNNRHKESNVIEIEKLKYNKIFTWDNFKEELTFIEARQSYDIANGITIIKSFDSHIELYYFGTKESNHNASYIYNSNVDLFERFILYFKYRGNDLITFADQYNVSVCENNDIIKNSENLLEYNIKILEKPNRFRFLYENGTDKLYLSKRETQCAAYFILQYSANDISEKLNLSRRTVESYLSNIKNKLSCSTKRSLIKKILDLKIVEKDSKENVYHGFYNYPVIKLDKACNYIRETTIDKLYFNCSNKNFYLTNKESICLFLLCHGHGAKEISNKIQCSHRTAETHIFNIHKKMGFKKKSALVFFSIKNNFLEMIIHAYPDVLKTYL